ncbi:MAG: Wzy polymerase domain-containing protein [Massilia sp.]
MMSLPFLLPVHRQPLPSFESEWAAAALGFACLLAALTGLPGMPLRIPAICGAPLGLALVVVLQVPAGLTGHPANAAIWCAYLLFAAALALAGQRTVQALGTETVYRRLAWALLAGGLASALVGFAQRAGWGGASVLLYPTLSAAYGVYGNVAQQNHFATQIALALGAAAHLSAQSGLPRRAFLACALALGAALVLSGSRSSVLYLASIGVVWIGIAGQRRLPWRGIAFVVCAGLGSVALLALAAHHNLVDPRLGRLVAYGEGLSPRLFYWGHALRMFAAHPLLGVGIDRFADALIAQLAPGETTYAVDQYAHNLPLQLLAVTGLAGLGTVALPFARLVRSAFAKRPARADLLGWTVLAILSVHSMFEQPLHYAYFLGMLAFFAGTLDGSGYTLTAPASRSCLRAAACSALAGLVVIGADYGRLADRFYGAEAGNPFDAAHRELAVRLHRDPFFAPLTELMAPFAFVANDAPLGDKLAFNTRLLMHDPVAEVAYRQAALLAEANSAEEARAQFQRAALAYPDQAAFYAKRLAMLAQDDPATFGALAAYAGTLAPTRPGSQ